MAYTNPVPCLDFEMDEPMKIVSDELDYKKIEKVYFAFIDVLGFKQTFEDIKISEKEAKADKYRIVFNYYFELMNSARFMEKGKSTGCYAGQTSDSLYFYTDRTDFLMEFIEIFSHFNLFAMSQDVFFRGGIAQGSLFKKENYQFYGDSVIHAYLMENGISKNPIIVIDEKTNSSIKNYEQYKQLVNKKSERYYIRPFAFLGQKVNLAIDDYKIRDIDEDAIKCNIAENKRLFEFDTSNYSKYIFLENEIKENKMV